MINVTPIAISANSQQYAVSITENLCQCYCLNATVQPQAEVKYPYWRLKRLSLFLLM